MTSQARGESILEVFIVGDLGFENGRIPWNSWLKQTTSTLHLKVLCVERKTVWNNFQKSPCMIGARSISFSSLAD